MAMANLQRLSKKLLSDNVIGAIRTAIFDGDLKLGQRLVETTLAERLGVSRGPVREALRALAGEGLVVINVHRGTFVVHPTAADVDEMYSLREVLETLAIQRAVELASKEELETLQEDANRYTLACRQKKFADLVELNMKFHGRLFQLARHRRASQIWSSLESQLRLCNTVGIVRTREDLTRASEEHLEISRVMSERNAERACRIMVQHIREAGRVVKNSSEFRVTSA